MNPLDALKSWLQDNIDMGSDLCFDNDGEVKSEHVLAAFNSLMDMFVRWHKEKADSDECLLVGLTTSEELARQPRHETMKAMSDNLVFFINDYLDRKYPARKDKT